LIVLDTDLLTWKKIASTHVVRIYLGGKLIYRQALTVLSAFPASARLGGGRYRALMLLGRARRAPPGGLRKLNQWRCGINPLMMNLAADEDVSQRRASSMKP
jgi:hypothetical protein